MQLQTWQACNLWLSGYSRSCWPALTQGLGCAEVIGSATALYLLFGLPLWAGVLITVVDVLILLAFGTHNFRILELLVFLLIATICG